VGFGHSHGYFVSLQSQNISFARPSLVAVLGFISLRLRASPRLGSNPTSSRSRKRKNPTRVAFVTRGRCGKGFGHESLSIFVRLRLQNLLSVLDPASLAFGIAPSFESQREAKKYASLILRLIKKPQGCGILHRRAMWVKCPTGKAL
jgi:hypothetical protein